jgi:beta-glucosidase
MALLILLILFAGLFNEGSGIVGDTFPFRNVSLDWSTRVDDLVSRLSPHEMIDQMAYAGGWNEGVTPPIPRLNILPYSWGTECLRGDISENSTGFPQAINLAATWNKELVKAVANATAYEVHAHYNRYSAEHIYGVHRGISCFSPVINIMRHPLWGRNQETYGECPYLSGMFAIYFVHGLQGPPSARYLNTNAGCKHFDSHNGPENIPESRFSFDVKLSEFDWRSTFLPAFHACVNAGSYGIMCSYNSINGVPSCGNPRLLTDILRTGMNFTGYVVADDDALLFMHIGHHYVNSSEEAAIVGLNAGVNLELADSPGSTMFESLHQAYDEGKIDNQTLIKRVKPLMYTRMRLGEFDPSEMNDYTKIPMDVIQCERHRTLAQQATLHSFVLLKNQNNFLPIRNPQTYPKVLFLGPMSNNPVQQYGDYAPVVDPFYVTTPLSSLQDSFSSSSYNEACLDGTKCLKYNQTDIVNYLEQNVFDLIVLSLGTGQEMEGEGNDRANMDLPNYQSQLLNDVLNVINPEKTKILLLIVSGTPVDIQIAEESNSVQAIIQLGFGAQELGEALKAAIIGDGLSQFGRLPYTWPKKLSDLPGSITSYDMTSGFTYRYFKGEPLYSFGYGLSYSSFSYSDLGFNGTTIKPGDSLTINFNVKNTGDRVSDEVVQIYLSIHLQNTSLANVSRAQLVDFDRLSDVNPSQSIAYQAIIKPEQMAVYIDGQGFVIVPATIEFKIGSFIQPYLTGNVTIVGQDYYVGQYISYASI